MMPQSVARHMARPGAVQMEYKEMLAWFQSQWKQGDHVTGIGPTGCGKTTLMQRLVSRRHYVTVFATKGKDSSMDRMIRAGYKKQTDWDGEYHDYIVLWPGGNTEEEVLQNQYRKFSTAINAMYKQGGWTFYFDEVSYMSDFLGMQRKLRWLLQQGRSSKLTVVALTQRPAFIPLAFYDMPTWLFFWNDNDHTNLKRIQGLGGVDGKTIREEVQSLAHREVLIVHNRHPYERVRTKVKL